jgi:hypothetical protein
MVNKFVAISLGALIALAPVATMAQTDTTAPAAKSTSTGSHRAHHRRQHNMSKERARAGAHHVHKKMTSAPKS